MFRVKASPSACDAFTQNMDDIDCPTPFFWSVFCPPSSSPWTVPSQNVFLCLLDPKNGHGPGQSRRPKDVSKVDSFRLSKVAQNCLANRGQMGRPKLVWPKSATATFKRVRRKPNGKEVWTPRSHVAPQLSPEPRTKHQPKPFVQHSWRRLHEVKQLR